LFKFIDTSRKRSDRHYATRYKWNFSPQIWSQRILDYYQRSHLQASEDYYFIRKHRKLIYLYRVNANSMEYFGHLLHWFCYCNRE